QRNPLSASSRPVRSAMRWRTGLSSIMCWDHGRKTGDSSNSGRFAVHDDQLDGVAAPVIVWCEAIGDAYALRRRRAAPAAELDRLQAQARQSQFEPEVLGADRTPRQHVELTVEQRLGEALPPRPAV